MSNYEDMPYYDVTRPISRVFDWPYVSSGSWAFRLETNRRVPSTYVPKEVQSVTSLSDAGVAQTFKSSWKASRHTDIELRLGLDTTKDGDNADYRVVSPTIIYTHEASATRAATSVCKLTLPVLALAAPFSWKYAHPAFHVLVEGELQSQPALGAPSSVNASVLVDTGLLAAARVYYDPLRSGVSDYTFVVRKALSIGKRCPIQDQLAFVAYDASNGFSLSGAGSWKWLEVSARLSREGGLDIGARANCPTTGSVLAIKANAVTRSLAAGVDYIRGSWSVALSLYVPDAIRFNHRTFGYGFKVSYS